MKTNTILLILLLLASACSGNVQQQSINSKSNYVLVASGYGTTKDLAERNALENLAKNIFVEVDSSFKAQEELVNSNFTSNYISNLNVKSNAYFIGIEYFNNKKAKKHYIVNVGLTKDALSSSINYIYNNLNVKIVDTLDKTKLRKELNNINVLSALMLYARKFEIATQNLDFAGGSMQSYQQLLQSKVNASAVVKFITSPDKVEIIINNAFYYPFQEIFLASGKAIYTVSAPGYISKTDTMFLNNGDNLNLEVFLQKQLANKIPIKIKLNNRSNIPDSNFNSLIQKLTSDNQMSIFNNTENSLVLSIDFLDTKSLANNYYVINTNINLEVTISGKTRLVFIPINYITSVNNAYIPFSFITKAINDNTKLFFANLY